MAISNWLRAISLWSLASLLSTRTSFLTLFLPITRCPDDPISSVASSGFLHWPNRVADAQIGKTSRQTIKPQVNDRGRVKRKQLAQQQSADDSDTQRMAQLGSCTGTQRQRHSSQQGRHRRHHDRTESKQTGLIDCLLRRFAFFPLSFQGKVNHHDGVFL